MRSRILTTIDQCKPVDQTTTPCRPKVYSTSELSNINTSKFSITAVDILWFRFGKGFLSLGTFSCYWPRAYSWHKLGALYSFDGVWLKYILPSVYPWLKWPLSFICSKITWSQRYVQLKDIIDFLYILCTLRLITVVSANFTNCTRIPPCTKLFTMKWQPQVSL